MRWWLVIREESSGYDSYPIEVRHVVAANTEAEIYSLFNEPERPEYGNHIIRVLPFPELPNLSRKKKPYILAIGDLCFRCERVPGGIVYTVPCRIHD